MCPKCRSGALKIKQRSGFERFMVFLTGKRKYMCRDCETFFRAEDRRRFERADLGSTPAAETQRAA